MKLFLFLTFINFGLQAKVQKAKDYNFNYEILTDQNDVVWGFDFLSSNQILFTEREGKLKILDLTTKKVTEIQGVPSVHNKGQGGLLDVRVYDQKQKKIYFTYAESVKKISTTTLASAEIENFKIKNLNKIFSATPAAEDNIHYGSRIEFDGKDYLYMTVGERNQREEVQKDSSDLGKIIRFNLKNQTEKPQHWTKGHRSPQGLAMDNFGNLWMSEMGPRGGDEINLVEKGLNYGWPDVTYGREYYGPKIGVESKSGTQGPVVHWTPSISPSGISFYKGALFSKWSGDLFVANLSGQHLRRLKIEKNKVIQEEILLKDLDKRFRLVRAGPDGYIYLSTDDGEIARLVPTK